MDTIVEITRRGGVTTLRLQSGDTVRLPSAVYLERRLAVGQAVDTEAYRAFVREKSYPHALETAVKYLALRERSENEVRARLRAACYDDGVIQRVMDTLAGHSLVSDSRFAGQWAYSRARKYGKGRIARELRSKGVSQADTRQTVKFRKGADQQEVRKIRKRVL